MSFENCVKLEIARLIPYLLSIVVYFTLFIPEGTVNWSTCLIRCLPVASLCIFVQLHRTDSAEDDYSGRILFGLIWSCLGDAWLTNLEGYLVQGIICFAIAHVAYISAFGRQPARPLLGAVCFGVSICMYFRFWSGLHGPIIFPVFCYMVIITTMVWRAVARLQLLEGRWTWSKLSACAGAILFYLSDCLLSTYMFIGPFPYFQALIMVAYYGGQLGIALSVVNNGNGKKGK